MAFCMRHENRAKCFPGSLGKFRSRERNGVFGQSARVGERVVGADSTKSGVERRLWKFTSEHPKGAKSAGACNGGMGAQWPTVLATRATPLALSGVYEAKAQPAERCGNTAHE